MFTLMENNSVAKELAEREKGLKEERIKPVRGE